MDAVGGSCINLSKSVFSILFTCNWLMTFILRGTHILHKADGAFPTGESHGRSLRLWKYRELRHDMRQHLIFLGELLENGDLEVAQDTLTELIERQESVVDWNQER